MTPRFELLPLDELKPHEEIDRDEARRLTTRLRAVGRVEEPLLVAEGSWVILNGHHRYAALRALGARLAPAWVVPYDDPAVALERWKPGPPLSKDEVVARAAEGRLFPPKTTKHLVRVKLPPRPTPLTELGAPGEPASERPRRLRSADGSSD